MAKPDWQNQNYKKANPVQKAAAGTLALGGLLAYGAKKAYDAFKNRKKDSDTSTTTGIDISKDIKARNKPMPISPKQRKENQKAIQEIVDSQEVKYVENAQQPKKRIKNPYRYAPQKTTRKITREELDEKLKKSNKQFDYQVKKNQKDSSNNNQNSSDSSSSSVKPPKDVKPQKDVKESKKGSGNFNQTNDPDGDLTRVGVKKKDKTNTDKNFTSSEKKRIMDVYNKTLKEIQRMDDRKFKNRFTDKDKLRYKLLRERARDFKKKIKQFK
tara:strand:+ start:4362 stop:5171 length:810 start_codon:yes stop_codon:yes gene_type:complete